MYAPEQASRYVENEVLSRSSEQLVPLLYEHLLVNLRKGIKAMRVEDFEVKGRALGKAMDIAWELRSSLDEERGGDLARRLGSLYAFWIQEISQASRSLEPARLDRVAEMVESLHEAWAEAARVVAGGAGGGG